LYWATDYFLVLQFAIVFTWFDIFFILPDKNIHPLYLLEIFFS